MSFAVSADAYDRFMGRYSIPLAAVFADFAGVIPGTRILDVGCGPGALTAELVRRLGDRQVTAVDPSESFVEAVRDRYPGVESRCAVAERLPQLDDTFDGALAQLVVHFMKDPVDGLREMGREARRRPRRLVSVGARRNCPSATDGALSGTPAGRTVRRHRTGLGCARHGLGSMTLAVVTCRESAACHPGGAGVRLSFV